MLSRLFLTDSQPLPTNIFSSQKRAMKGKGKLADLFVNDMAGDDTGEYEAPAAPNPEGVAAS